MKRVLAILAIICMVCLLPACKKGEPATSNDPTGSGFTKPENSVTVLTVTINPQFNLYLDADGKVLAVEAVNADAQSFVDRVAYSNESYETVVKNILSSAKDAGFVQENATVEIRLIESSATNDSQTAILENAKKAAADTADTLQLTLEVSAINALTLGTTVHSEATTTNTTVRMPGTTNTTNAPVRTTAAHTHHFTDADCTTPQTCSCGATAGSALGHSYQNGVCTRCGAKDPNNNKPLTSVLEKRGKWVLNCVSRENFYRISGTLCNPEEDGLKMFIGDEMDNPDSEMLENYELYGGVYYSFENGKSIEVPFTTVTENGKIITCSNENGERMVLERTDENTLVCREIAGEDLGSFPAILQAGMTLTFKAE